MTITWLGQAGLLLEGGGIRIMIDPYLSDSVKKFEPLNARRVPVDERFFAITPDVMIFTHDHLDHYDPETAPRFFAKTDKHMSVLCPHSVWQKARTHGNGHNYVQFDRGAEWTQDGFRFSAVKAAHSDPDAIGVIIEDTLEGKTYYVTGDTLYHRDIFADLPDRIDAVFLPINGVGNNMNMEDAARFCERIAPVCAVPMHCGLFDDIDMTRWAYPRKVVPTIYEKVALPE